MKLRHLAGIGGCLLAFYAWGADWKEFFEGNDGSKMYLETSSRALKNGEARVWMYIDFPSQKADGYGIYRSVRQEILVDCRRRQTASLQVQVFPEIGMGGAGGYQWGVSDPVAKTNLRDAPPGSMTEALLQLTCQ
ncbi:surface-adhesin E family protein [Burkholderia pseudomallei]|uniref:surface-adhesin E family protein n=1 Tax=Burkholderia pseudomallei TaxID=28450 RepID=UPI0039B763BB